MSPRRFVVDTNIVVGLLDNGPRSVAVALRLSRFQDDLLVIAPQTLYEAYVVLTREVARNGYGLPAETAYAALEALRLRFRHEDDPPGLAVTWLDLCRRHGVTGKPAHDARIAAFVLLTKADGLVSDDAGLRRYGLEIV